MTPELLDVSLLNGNPTYIFLSHAAKHLGAENHYLTSLPIGDVRNRRFDDLIEARNFINLRIGDCHLLQRTDYVAGWIAGGKL